MATADELNLHDSQSGIKTASAPNPSLLAMVAGRVPDGAWKYLLVLHDIVIILAAFVAACAYQLENSARTEGIPALGAMG